MFAHIANIVSDFIQHPVRVFVVSCSFVFVGLIFDGSLIRLWRLQRGSQDITARMQVLREKTVILDQKIKQAKDPNFLELEAREKFDLAGKGDLVFVFSDEE